MKRLIFLLPLTFILACNQDYDPPELKAIQNLGLNSFKDGIAELHADAVFHNPNKVRAKIRAINIKVYVDDKEAASINQKMKTVIPAKADFTVPIDARISLKDLSAVNTLLSVFTGKKMLVRYEGYMRLSYNGVVFKVPVNHKEEIRVRL